MKTPKILHYDDEKVIRELYGEDIEKEGWDYAFYQSPKNVIKDIKKEKPDVVLLDIRLGEYDGLEILQDIREKYYNLPVILLSVYSSFKRDLKSIQADHYVLKNDDFSELKTKIKMCLENSVWDPNSLE
ncbi:MAG: response regulator [archaeon]